MLTFWIVFSHDNSMTRDSDVELIVSLKKKNEYPKTILSITMKFCTVFMFPRGWIQITLTVPWFFFYQQVFKFPLIPWNFSTSTQHNFEQTCMVPRWWILITLVVLWLSRSSHHEVGLCGFEWNASDGLSRDLVQIFMPILGWIVTTLMIPSLSI